LKTRNLGHAFKDEILKVSEGVGHFKQKETDWKDRLIPNFDSNFGEDISKSPWRITFFYVIIFILFFIIFLRLFHLQIAEGQVNRNLADGNRIKVKIIHAPRGIIYDRNGKILASNSPAFRLYEKEVKKTRLITREDALEMDVKNDPRVSNLEVDNVRRYPMGEKLAHVIGYVGEISETQLKNIDYNSYHLGDRIGQSGIESQYEKILRGVDGGEIIEVDSMGIPLRTLRRNPPISGQNIYLTIDANLQDKLYSELIKSLQGSGSCCGVGIAMDPSNGQVLALLSLPSFDPNIFTRNEDEDAISEIFSDSNFPILNRAIGGTYPPGSTFKIISSLAALSSGKITPSTTFIDNGFIYLGPYKFSNWYFNEYGKVEGSVDLLKAIQRSNDIYYYQVGQIIGEKALAEMSKKLKLGGKLDIDLPGEVSGLVPDDAWKRKNFDVGWYPGDTLHMAIGQGFVLTTPIQVLGMTAFIAGNGTLYQPQLVLTNFKSKILTSNVVSQDKINVVKQGLELVPKSGGTGWPFFSFPIETAGKTGTAEFGDPKDKTHGWYTSYAPANDPKIVLTILVEGGGEGSNVAAPVAKEVYRWFFSPDKNNLIKDVYVNATDSGKTLGE